MPAKLPSITRTYLLLAAIMVASFQSIAQEKKINVGAKHFTEGYIISEMIALVLEDAGFEVDRKFNLGGTMVCFSALTAGEIDVYPEYSGTIASEILKGERDMDMAVIRSQLNEQYSLAVSEPLGFNNTYALVISRSLSHEKNIQNISDLQRHPELDIGLSYEFLQREDGWKQLARVYRLPQEPVGLEHGLAYQALSEGKIAVTDAYSTDGEIKRYDLVTLNDDLDFFPAYLATILYRTGLSDRAIEVLKKLQATISEEEIRQLNLSVTFNEIPYAEVAASFLKEKGLIKNQIVSTSTTQEIISKTLVHLEITFLALALAVLISIPVAVAVSRTTRLAGAILYFAGLLQTIPSIALLAILIPLTGIGTVPAIIALFLYALLPILRNTVTGIQGIDPALLRIAEGMGMSKWQRMRWIELPLATPSILAGIRIAAVINIGTATLAAFIGAGGLGEFIVTGLALNNQALILKGAIPAAALAIIVELIFTIVERIAVPRYLKGDR